MSGFQLVGTCRVCERRLITWSRGDVGGTLAQQPEQVAAAQPAAFDDATVPPALGTMRWTRDPQDGHRRVLLVCACGASPHVRVERVDEALTMLDARAALGDHEMRL